MLVAEGVGVQEDRKEDVEEGAQPIARVCESIRLNLDAEHVLHVLYISRAASCISAADFESYDLAEGVGAVQDLGGGGQGGGSPT